MKFALDDLNNDIMFLKFTKADGSIREMYATKSLDIIPKEKHPKGTEKQLSNTVIRVFDVDINEWRSVKEENIIEAKVAIV